MVVYLIQSEETVKFIHIIPVKIKWCAKKTRITKNCPFIWISQWNWILKLNICQSVAQSAPDRNHWPYSQWTVRRVTRFDITITVCITKVCWVSTQRTVCEGLESVKRADTRTELTQNERRNTINADSGNQMMVNMWLKNQIKIFLIPIVTKKHKKQKLKSNKPKPLVNHWMAHTVCNTAVCMAQESYRVPEIKCNCFSLWCHSMGIYYAFYLLSIFAVYFSSVLYRNSVKCYTSIWKLYWNEL